MTVELVTRYAWRLRQAGITTSQFGTVENVLQLLRSLGMILRPKVFSVAGSVTARMPFYSLSWSSAVARRSLYRPGCARLKHCEADL